MGLLWSKIKKFASYMKAAAEQCPNPYSKVGAPVEIPPFRSKGGMVFVSAFQGLPKGQLKVRAYVKAACLLR